MTSQELADFVYSNYDKLTGQPLENRDGEQDFDPIIYTLIGIHNIVISRFQDSYNRVAELSQIRYEPTPEELSIAEDWLSRTQL